MNGAKKRRLPRLLFGVVLACAGAWAAWSLFVRIQGDSEVVFGSDELSNVSERDGALRGEIVLVNRGRQLAALRRVEGRVVEDPRATVHVTRQGTRPSEPGLWIANLLKPGESCVAEVEVHLAKGVASGLTVELDVHEIGRRPLVHRRGRFPITPPSS